MNYCSVCIGNAINVLLDKVGSELEHRNINDYSFLLASATSLVDNLVARASKFDKDQFGIEEDEVDESKVVEISK
jgi:hypothetical protein